MYWLFFQEKAQQGNAGAAGSDPTSNPSEPADDPVPDGTETNRLLDWPQLELERVNSFLTSRLEEIKNTIKDSIRASFSMYDLNLDVNDFPKKAAMLEGNHLLSHLNGSSDAQQIDLDLAPLSLGTFKNHLDLSNGWEDTTVSCPSLTSTAAGVPAGPKDIQRLHATPSLTKLIRVQSPVRCTSTGPDTLAQVPAQSTAKSKEETPDLKNAAISNGTSKSKKNKKQQQRQEMFVSEQNPNKQTKAASGTEPQRNHHESKDTAAPVAKVGNKQLHHCTENHRNVSKKPEEGKPSKHATNGSLSNAPKGKGEAETRERPDQESENKAYHTISANGQQHHQQQQQQQQQAAKGKNKKNKKGEKSSSALGTWSYD